jgi:hypothetical protein
MTFGLLDYQSGWGSGIIAFVMPRRPDKLSVEISGVHRQRQANDAREKGETTF